jgi:hypothetical protein
MTTTQQQILDELLRLLSCPDRWSCMKRASGEWIHTGKVLIQLFTHVNFGKPFPNLLVEVNGVPWDMPPECHTTVWEVALPIYRGLVNDGAKGNEDLILGFLKTAA